MSRTYRLILCIIGALLVIGMFIDLDLFNKCTLVNLITSIKRFNLSRQGAQLIIILRPNHGIGNLLFMYASAFGISLKNHRKLKIYPNYPEMKENFNISSEWVTCYNRHLTKLSYPKCCLYYNDTFIHPNTSAVLYGYFVSYKYFHEYRDLLLREFSFSKQVSNKASSFLIKVREEYKNSAMIALHIRRGDFAVKRNLRLGYTVATEAYVTKAMKYFQSLFNCTFIVATNDKIWVDNVLSKFQKVDYVYTGMTSRVLDMAILSACDHVITSTGTFSWWIGYLSQGTVLYYKNFPKNNSWLASEFGSLDDYYLPEWIGLD